MKAREHYGFEYTDVEDPSRMSSEELSKPEVLKRLQKILKNVSVPPLRLEENDATNKPATHLGRAFDDLPELPQQGNIEEFREHDGPTGGDVASAALANPANMGAESSSELNTKNFVM